MWMALGLLGLALVLYVTEWVPIELASVVLLCLQLGLFAAFPVPAPDGRNLLSPDALLAGFGNTALLTVMALLVVAEGLSRTGALDRLADRMVRMRMPPRATIVAMLFAVMAHGAFISDTSVVVMFMPVMLALAGRVGLTAGRVMMPLSFAAVLGGISTLIGSSTNLMVSSALIAVGQRPLGFFEQTPMALPLMAVGAAYVLVVMPRLLPRRGGIGRLSVGSGKQFVSQATVTTGSPLVGARAAAGQFRALPEITVHLVIRGDALELPPYDELVLQPGDSLVVAGDRRALAETAGRYPGLLVPPEENGDDEPPEVVPPKRLRERDPSAEEKVVVEAMVPPTSRFTGFTVNQLGLQRHHGITVLGIERRSRMMRNPMAEIRLQAGDVLLLVGRWSEIDQLREERDLVVISGSAGALPKVHHTRFATAVFLAAVGASALGVVPIVTAAFVAATLLVIGGALTPRQAIRAIDYKVVLLVGNALALSHALEVTGGATFIATALLGHLGQASALPALAAYFGLVAVATNLLSHNATALLFTPIGVGLAQSLGFDPHMFAVATVLAANCSFATPIGHQVHLLVMGPGHYRFVDYVRVGAPLVVLLWATFVVAAKFVWGL
ncbi:MAG: SLC13 family permease [Actinomycetota bacterium]